MDTSHTAALRILALLLAVGVNNIDVSPTIPPTEHASAPPTERTTARAQSQQEPDPTEAAPIVAPKLSVPEQEMVEWAKGLFEAASLRLPTVIVSFHDDTTACHGTEGRWEHAEGSVDRVRICTTHEKAHVQDEWRRRTLIHELGHAWAAENLDDASMDRYMVLRGLTSWNNTTQEWGTRGTEHAAEIISWGVIDQRIHLWKLPDATCPAMTAAYRLLTGMAPSTGIETSCRL
jgi:hypothetical protein